MQNQIRKICHEKTIQIGSVLLKKFLLGQAFDKNSVPSDDKITLNIRGVSNVDLKHLRLFKYNNPEF